MPILVTCPSCQKTIPIKEKYAGKKGACPHCRGPLMVPAVTAESPTATEDDWLGGIENEPAPVASQHAPAPAPKPAVVKPAAAAAAPPARPAAGPPTRPAKPASATPVSQPKPTVELDSGSIEMPAVKPPATLSGLKNPLAKPQSAAARAAPAAKPQPAAAAPKPARAPNDLGLAPLAGDDFLGELAGLPMAAPAAAGGGVVLGKAVSQQKSKPRTALALKGKGDWFDWFSYAVIAAGILFAVFQFPAAGNGSIPAIKMIGFTGTAFFIPAILAQWVRYAQALRDGEMSLFMLFAQRKLVALCWHDIRHGQGWGVSPFGRTYKRGFFTAIGIFAIMFAAVGYRAATHGLDPSKKPLEEMGAVERWLEEHATNRPATGPTMTSTPVPPFPSAPGITNWPPGPPTGFPAQAPPVAPTPSAVPVSPPPQSAPYAGGAPPKTDAERMAEALADLTSSDPGARQFAVSRLESVSPSKSLRPQLLAALEPLLDPLKLVAGDQDEMETLLQIYAKWATVEQEDKLIACLARLPEQAEAAEVLQALARFKTERSAAAIAKQLECFFRCDAAAAALRELGPLAEDAVWPLLNSEEAHAREAACGVLAECGSAESIKRIRAIAAENLQTMDQEAVQRAIESIQSRLPGRSAAVRNAPGTGPQRRGNAPKPARGFQPAS